MKTELVLFCLPCKGLRSGVLGVKSEVQDVRSTLKTVQEKLKQVTEQQDIPSSSNQPKWEVDRTDLKGKC